MTFITVCSLKSFFNLFFEVISTFLECYNSIFVKKIHAVALFWLFSSHFIKKYYTNPRHITPPYTTWQPHHTTPHHTSPHHTSPHLNTPHHTTPHHTTPHHTTPHHTTPHHTTPHHTSTHHTTPHHTTSSGRGLGIKAIIPSNTTVPPSRSSCWCNIFMRCSLYVLVIVRRVVVIVWCGVVWLLYGVAWRGYCMGWCGVVKCGCNVMLVV